MRPAPVGQTLQRGKENKDVITFSEKSVPGIREVRPLIVNATNRKALRKLYKSVTADALTGKRIQLYIDHKVRDPQDGSLTDGIRIRDRIPAAAQPAARCDECGAEIRPLGRMNSAEVAAYTRSKYGRALCEACAVKAKEAAKAAEASEAAQAAQDAAEAAETTETANNTEVSENV